MKKIYTNQNINNEEVVPFTSEVQTTDQDWWMIYDAVTMDLLIEPQQCSGFTSSPFTMVISDNKEELEQYIIDNQINDSINEN
jgi:hypothetical protein